MNENARNNLRRRKRQKARLDMKKYLTEKKSAHPEGPGSTPPKPAL